MTWLSSKIILTGNCGEALWQKVFPKKLKDVSMWKRTLIFCCGTKDLRHRQRFAIFDI
jgi:hypothetical protein